MSSRPRVRTPHGTFFCFEITNTTEIRTLWPFFLTEIRTLSIRLLKFRTDFFCALKVARFQLDSFKKLFFARFLRFPPSTEYNTAFRTLWTRMLFFAQFESVHWFSHGWHCLQIALSFSHRGAPSLQPCSCHTVFRTHFAKFAPIWANFTQFLFSHEPRTQPYLTCWLSHAFWCHSV